MTFISRLRHAAPVAVVLLAAMTGAASSQAFPSGGNDFGGNMTDTVTGYICVTTACDVVRMPQSDCICQKQNPAEENLSRLQLACSTREAGQWVQCPVPLRHGIEVPFGN